MGKEDYLKDRLDDQINWYDAKSALNKKYYGWLQSIVIILAAFIPFLSGYTEKAGDFLLPVIGLTGFVISVLSSLIALFKFQEKWIHYRTTSEALKREKYLFQAKIEPYDTEDSLRILIKRTESILSKENLQWSDISQKQTDKST